MARYSVSARTTAGSTTLPIISLYAVANISGSVVEIGVTNTTTSPVALAVVRLTSTGTQGTALTEAKFNDRSVAASMTGFNTHSVAPTVTDELARASLGSAVGTGFVWTFGGGGLLIPAGTANGVGVIVATGTGQACDAYIIWDE